ncbi:MAG: transcription termination factor Rho [Nocardioides sp.]
MLLADLKAMAGGMGIAGSGSMKKAQLVDAIKGAQSASSGGARPKADPEPEQPRREQSTRTEAATEASGATDSSGSSDQGEPKKERGQQAKGGADRSPQADQSHQGGQGKQSKQNDQSKQGEAKQGEAKQGGSKQGDGSKQGKGAGQQSGQQSGQQPGQQSGQPQNNQPSDQGEDGEDGEGRAGRNRRRRGRDRNRTGPGAGPGTGSAATGGGGHRNEPDTTILEDDVLVPAAGILDVLDNYAFVRTSGYLAGPDDVYLSLSMVRKYGLRRGDAVVGQVRQPREGERKEKFNPMVRIDSINGGDPEAVRNRVEFDQLTPLFPSERLRLETGPDNIVGRIVDIAAPIGKGQRGLIVSPGKAGKTMLLQSIASSITANNPECHLMVVLIDERPEEVTEFQRSVKGEVIASTFDRPAVDHTTVAELAIERAKRLVELGHDVVVLVDGITRMGRAYTHATPTSGRVLAGGVDAASLYPTKKFFGAARNIENGGSLTVLATALVETGSATDEVIFEEFTGTANLEIRLRRELADKRLFPAIDVVASGTRREEQLMGEEELSIVAKLRRELAAQGSELALETLLERIGKTQTNIEFLMQLHKTTPGQGR